MPMRIPFTNRQLELTDSHIVISGRASDTAAITAAADPPSMRAARRRYPRPRRRDFEAAAGNELLADWSRNPLTSDEVLRRELRSLRARSRQQCGNNPYAKKFVGMVRKNVVGPKGVRLQARAKNPTGKLDKSANQAIEEAWTAWGRKKACDVEGRLTWTAMQQLFVATVATDGEAILRIRRGPQWGRWGFALQFLDAELLDVSLNKKLPNGRYIRMGVELDQYRRRLAYHFIDPTEHLDGSLSYYGGKPHIRVPAEDIIHGFVSDRVGQTRGVPWAAAALLRLKMEGSYEEAALVAARVGASKMGFLLSETGEEYTGDGEGSDGAVVSEVEPGSLEQLPNGVKFEAFDPTYPRGDMDPFIRAMLRGTASGLEVSYHSMANDLENVNYSSLRAGLLDERDHWETLQGWLEGELLDPVYSAWLPLQLLAGNIAVDGNALPVGKEEKFQRVSWNPRRWPWVDPAKEVKANRDAVAGLLKSRSQVIREQGQDDPEDVWEEVARENAALDSLGLTANQESPADEEEEREEEAV